MIRHRFPPGQPDRAGGDFRRRATETEREADRDFLAALDRALDAVADRPNAIDVLGTAIEIITIRRHSESDQQRTWRVGCAVRRVYAADVGTEVLQ